MNPGIETGNWNHDTEELLLAPRQSRFQEFWEQIKSNRLAFFGMVIFVGFFLVATLGFLLTTGARPIIDPSTIRLEERLLPPLSRSNLDAIQEESEIPLMGIYILGTDDLGRDVFARMLQGSWVSLTVGFVAVGISIAIGIFLGGVAGYYGQNPINVCHLISLCALLLAAIFFILGDAIEGSGILIVCLLFLFLPWIISDKDKRPAFIKPLFAPTIAIDTLIMRFVDVMLCFPSFFLILTVVAILPASIINIMVVIGLTSWMGACRFVRAEFLALREQDFVTAAKALGVSDFRIIFRHMVPNAIAPVLVSSTIGIAGAILTEAGLSFLGFGVPPPDATWGNILSDGKDFLFDAPWLTFVPGIAILIVVLSFNLVGEGLRDIMNPKLRERL